MAALTREHSEELELLLDRYSIGELLEELASICREKADHIRTNWQDQDTARRWDKNANTLDKIAPKIVY